MPILILVLEILIFVMFINSFGFFYTLLVYLIPTLIGFYLLKAQNKNLILDIQNSTSPPQDLLVKGLTFLAAILLIVPSFFSKLIGSMLLLPLVRTILAWGFQGFLLKKIFSRSSFFYQFGGKGMNFYYRKFEVPPFQNQSDSEDEFSQGEVLEAEFKKIEEINLIDGKPKKEI